MSARSMARMKPPAGLRGLGAFDLHPLVRLPADVGLHVFEEAGDVVVEATVRGQFVGSLTMSNIDTQWARHPDWMRMSCARALRNLAARAGRALGVCMVLETGISPEWFGRGLGLALYNRALVEASRRGAALVPNSCLHDDTPGTTSAMAQATWRRLAQLPGMLAEYHKGQVIAVYAGGAR